MTRHPPALLATDLPLPSSLKTEFDNGFPALRGTRIAGEIPLSQSVLNEILSHSAPAAGFASLELKEFNTIVVRILGFLPLTATIVRVDPPLRIVFHLPFAVRLAASMVQSRLPSYVRIKGGEAAVDLSAVPQLAQYPQVSKYVRITQLRTSSSRLIVSFEIEVTND